ncbi:MAG TPA: uroporphyrinogen decarboxylase [Gemmatimonadaceae bacterium]|nr:uroporphyrinogen decarboxylase [Gemmatimonadaceae bacterium]
MDAALQALAAATDTDVVTHKLLAAARGENVGRPPVWFMRQAGRYLPEYREVRKKADFLTMVRTPDLAAEVTVQPVEIVGVDAAIIFSDILVVPEAMGMHLVMDEGSGPHFPAPVRTREAVRALAAPDVRDTIAYTLEAIRRTKRILDGRVPLIGFAGAPWTLASYMIEGEGTKHFHVVKKFVFREPALVHDLLARLSIVIGDFLIAQVQAGADIVQLFDSWGSALAPREYEEFALRYVREIVTRVKRETNVPVITFAPGTGMSLEAIAATSGADVLGIDWQTPARVARQVAEAHGKATQGHLDPVALFGTPDEVRARTQRMLDEMHSPGYIANLGHGVLPDTPVENAKAFVQTVKEFSPPASH